MRLENDTLFAFTASSCFIIINKNKYKEEGLIKSLFKVGTQFIFTKMKKKNSIKEISRKQTIFIIY